MLTSEILQNHGYNVINVEEGNHGEIKKKKQMLFCPEGLHDNPLRNSGWWRTTWGTSGCKWMEKSLEVW